MCLCRLDPRDRGGMEASPPSCAEPEHKANPLTSPNGNFSDGPSPINVENVALLLAKAMGPDRAWSLLQECGLTPELSEMFTRTCDILRIAEKRQR